MVSSLDEMDLDAAREAYPSTLIPPDSTLDAHLRLARSVEDGLTRELYDMLGRFGFRAVEAALIRAVQGWDVPPFDATSPPLLVDSVDLAVFEALGGSDD